MTAFKNLPPWQDFARGRETDMLRMRLAFTEILQGMHQRTLAEHSCMDSVEAEREAHERWDAEQARKPKRRKQQEPLMPCPCCRAAS